MKKSLLEDAGSIVCFLHAVWYWLHFLNMVFNMHVIYFLLRATEREGNHHEKLRYKESCKANAVPRDLHRFVFTKQEFSNTAKLSIFQSDFVVIFTYGHESWEMIVSTLLQVQAAAMNFCEEFTW